ncbi:MAG: hypothetical protein VYB38_08435 [Bacteroidota bacterium]|nr:hypothetical protein [Bacteroidota bacterium]
MTYIQVIIEIIKNVNSHIDEQTNLLWAEYDRTNDVKSEMETDIKDFEKGNIEQLEKYSLYFGPTGTFQEIAISNGWGKEFILMANQFDEIYEKIKAST